MLLRLVMLSTMRLGSNGYYLPGVDSYERTVRVEPRAQIVFFIHRDVVLAQVFFPTQYYPEMPLELLSRVAEPYASVNFPR
jgi:hypothetical protein